jgi:uncharacterized damage-inducible protein DinB
MGTTEELFQFNSWANLKLIDFCADLPPEALDGKAPGTYGSILDTLRHISGAEERYLLFIDGRSERPPVMEKDGLDIPALRREAEGRAERWSKLLESSPDIEQVKTRTRLDGLTDRVAVKTLLVQAIHHGNDHRTQVCTVIGSLGLEIPDLSAWTFYPEPAP